MEEKPNTTPEQIYQDVELVDMMNSRARYIDPKTDFAFKHFFGKEIHKDLLIKFLNSLFNGRKVIVDLQYSNIEQKGITKDHRETRFDLHCLGDKGERFIIEMQKTTHKHFKERMVYYASQLINQLGISVNSDWDYNLPEVYLVAILDFNLEDSDPDLCVHAVNLQDESRNEQFYPKLRYLFVELPKFNKAEHDLETDQDYWLYILKNLKTLEEIPAFMTKKQEFVKLLEIAEVSNLSPEEMDEYQQNLKVLRDNYSTHKTAEERGETKGKEEKAIEVAIRLKQQGVSLDIIAKATDLTTEQIEAL